MAVRRLSRAVVAVAVTAAVAGCGSTTPSTAPLQHSQAAATSRSSTIGATRAAAPGLAKGADAWVAVSVARLWQSPSSPWSVDAPALKAPVRFRAWLRAMSLSQRRALDLRSDTEALMGDRVVVVRLRPRWAKVVVPSQPSQKDSRGYPGWVPRRQLTAAAPAGTGQVATVTTRTAWLRGDDDAARRQTEISFGTDLPVVGTAPGYVRVAVPGGSVRRLPTSAVAVHAPGRPALAASRSALTTTAKSFLGLSYLWGGLSGFGIDCSGLTWLDYRVHGILIPRDALPQSRAGAAVSTRRAGDLVFYADHGVVHHVSMYLGDGWVIHAPHTGDHVRIVAFAAAPLRGEYAGSRRYLD
ncbi:MAG: C40 family peptidase [Propionibacteriales bacterium]|nr:C40 family peptidase [Propionibacteriales bacterium]